MPFNALIGESSMHMHRRRNMFDTGGAKLQNLQTVKKQQLYLFFAEDVQEHCTKI